MARALTAAVLLVLLVAGCMRGGEAPAAEATVERVVDGDTIVLAGGERVRLVQVDAPEPAEGECYGDEAGEELRRLLPAGAEIVLERDPRLDDVDRFGRLLRYVVREELNVNLELVRRGAAAPYFFGGDRGRHADELLDAAEEALAAGRGLWGACPTARLLPELGVETR